MTLKPFKKRSKAVEVYQIKVTLAGSQPPIWRRVQVASDTTLANFHTVLQSVMGWTNSHLHQFVIRGKYFAPRDPFSEFGGPKMGSETKTSLADVVSGARSRLRTIRCVSLARAPVPPRIAAESEVMKSYSGRWPIHSTSGTKNCWNGLEVPSIRRNSI